MSDKKSLTAKQWQRRALKAEEHLESIQSVRRFEHELELIHHHELAMCKVALKEAQDAINWALEQST